MRDHDPRAQHFSTPEGPVWRRISSQSQTSPPEVEGLDQLANDSHSSRYQFERGVAADAVLRELISGDKPKELSEE